MTAKDYTTSILVSQSPEQVFHAVTNVRGWWSEQIEGRTDALDEVFNYHYQDVHRSRMRIVEFVPNERVVWLVEDNYFNFITDQTEWKNTRISFEIEQTGDQTELIFTHVGLVPANECYHICSDAWGNYIRGSLKDLIEKGRGNPNPYQTAVDSAEKKKSNNQQAGSYSRTFLIDKAPATVFNAVSDVSKWWCTAFKGLSQSQGDEFEVSFSNMHYSRHRVTESLPFQKIEWLVIDSRICFVSQQQEWTGTRNIFEISAAEGKTLLIFTHAGLVPELECFSNCLKGWNYFLESSLLPFILEGKGNPGE